MEFTKGNIEEQWEWDLINEFPEFFLEISDQVMNIYNKWLDKNDPNFPKVEDLVNLRSGFEFHSSWKGIMRDHLLAIRKLIQQAKENSHEISYKGFIMKEKFNTLRDQGDIVGKDRELYKNQYYDLVDELYRISSNLNRSTGLPLMQ
jgi:hypothetical protein